jgi:UDP-glucose 4-epimerase
VAPVIAESINFPAALNEIFNVGADVPFTVNYLAKVVSAAMGAKCNVKHLDPRNEVKYAFSDHSKAEGAFGQRRKTSLEEGIRIMAAWVKENGARTSPVFKDIEIFKNLPPSWAQAALSETSTGRIGSPAEGLVSAPWVG